MTIQIKYKREDWKSLATCIRTEQVPADEIVAIFEDNPDFYKWYKKEYMNDNDQG
jgi:hypothetical protein